MFTLRALALCVPWLPYTCAEDICPAAMTHDPRIRVTMILSAFFMYEAGISACFPSRCMGLWVGGRHYPLRRFLNIFGALLLMMHNGEIERVFMAVFFIVLLTPTSFLCWFRPAYKANQLKFAFHLHLRNIITAV
uniref:Secretory carrier-associated membrane protein n=1 Tax=Cacopsylla melanoneura TaxID=428564 RepID=A0A8D9E2J9_9HEMI